MTESITIVGTASAPPTTRTTQSGRTVADVRIAVTERRRDPDGSWVDAGTSWYRVSAWGALAQHAAASIRKGDPVIVHGRVRVVDWESGERSGRSVEVTAEAIGHSMQFGTTRFERAERRGPAVPTPAGGESAGAGAVVPSTAPAPVDDAGWALAPAGGVPAPDETPF